MIELHQPGSDDSGFISGALSVLSAIEATIAQCRQSQQAKPDQAVARELQELELLSDAVAESWPLSEVIKQRIDIGPFAAKNIEDWNPALASSLMNLDYMLRHDGAASSTEAQAVGLSRSAL